jgi:hypothetical protein
MNGKYSTAIEVSDPFILLTLILDACPQNGVSDGSRTHDLQGHNLAL